MRFFAFFAEDLDSVRGEAGEAGLSPSLKPLSAPTLGGGAKPFVDLGEAGVCEGAGEAGFWGVKTSGGDADAGVAGSIALDVVIRPYFRSLVARICGICS